MSGPGPWFAGLRVRLIFAWYDLWIGVFIDRVTWRVYVFPLPCIGIVFQRRHLVHPITQRPIAWHEHQWNERPYHDGQTLRTCAVSDCPFSEIVPAEAANSQEGPG